jgi:dephospho-CoA kinase
MNKQLPDEEKMEKSDFVIYNDGSHTLISQILNIHQELISK